MPGQLLFVPTGWWTAERSNKSILIYGVRKSLCIASAQGARNFEASIEMMKRAGKNERAVKKFESALQLIKPTC